MSISPTSLFLPLRGLNVHYLDWGGSGQPLILLHGLASTAHIWDLIAPALRDDFRVVALDWRGHGLSDKPPAGYSHAELAEDLGTFLTALEFDRPLLVGHSWGGNIAVQFAATYPNRLDKLILVDGGTFEPGRRMTWEETEPALAPLTLDGLWRTELERRLAKWYAPVWSPVVAEILLASYETDVQGRVTARFPREQHRQVVRAMWEQRPTELAKQICCPVLLLMAAPADEHRFGQRWFWLKQEDVELFTANLAQGRVEWLPNSIHDIPLQHPQLVIDRIRQFAKSSSPGQPIR